MAYVLALLVFAAALVQAPLASGELWWDIGNAFGFLAFAGLLYLFLDTGFGGRQRAHKLISYGTVALIGAHVLWLWVPDVTLWQYAAPDAPPYMLAGFAALVLVIAMILLALPALRRFWHTGHQNFKRWHYWLSLSAIGAAFWHIAGSGFYVSRLEAWLLLAMIVTVAGLHHRSMVPPPGSTLRQLWGLPLIAALFVSLKALGA